MDPERLCMGCMGDRGAGSVCPACSHVEGRGPDTPLYLPPRTLLREQYLIGRVLGHGGFGVTYLGWDLNLNLKLAIKEYLPSDLATRSTSSPTVTPYSGESKQYFEYGLGKFLDEGRALARFQNHPGVVSVLNFFRDNGTGYLVMSFVEGMTFKEYLERSGGRVPYTTALPILTAVMDALRAVHEAGMLHRDISPDNIFITDQRQVKLLDFGAARNSVGEQSKSLSVILKPGYAPEEQYRTKGKQGAWTDVYALGATFYRALTGEVPPESLDRLERDELVPPSQLGIPLPAAAEAALLKALSVRATQRYQNMRELQDALHQTQTVPQTRPAPGSDPNPNLDLTQPGPVPAFARPQPLPPRPVPPRPVPAPGPSGGSSGARKVLLALLAGGLLLGGLLVAGLFALFLLSDKGPHITGATMPAQIAADGKYVEGELQFTDADGDVSKAVFEVVEAADFKGFEFETGAVAGQKQGRITFRVFSPSPQRVVLSATLVDRKGHKSAPYRVSFEAVAARPPARSGLPLLHFKKVTPLYDQTRGGRYGLVLRVDMNVQGARGRTCSGFVTFWYTRERYVPGHSPRYTASGGALSTVQTFTPEYDNNDVSGHELFVPYDEFPDFTGRQEFQYRVQVFQGDQALAGDHWGSFALTRGQP